MKAVYSAVFLDAPERLLDLADGLTTFRAAREDWTEHADHMTIKFLPTADDLNDMPIGKIVDLWVTEFVYSPSCVAARVSLGDAPSLRERVQNEHPHVTIATAPGVKPVFSNRILDYVWPPDYEEVSRRGERDWPWYVRSQKFTGRVGVMCEDNRVRFDLYKITPVTESK